METEIQGGGLAATFDLAAFGLYMIAPVNSKPQSKTLRSMREVQGRLARTTREDVFLFVVTRLWKMSSFLVSVYLLLAFVGTAFVDF